MQCSEFALIFGRTKFLLSILLILNAVIKFIAAQSFDANKHVFYEMHCRSTNKTTNPTLSDIDLSVLDNSNLIFDGSRSNRTIREVKNCRWNWNPNRPTRFFIHGYYSTQDVLTQYAKAYLERGDYNFIAINWLRGARTINYMKARNRVQQVGEAVAKFIDYLVTIGLNLDDLILVGHSLGVFHNKFAKKTCYDLFQ